MAASFGMLIYMMVTGYVQLPVGVIYILIWAIYFWRAGLPRTMGTLFQAPIYGWFIYISLRYTPSAGLWIIAWILAVGIITWPRFPREGVPGFINGMKAALFSGENKDSQST